MLFGISNHNAFIKELSKFCATHSDEILAYMPMYVSELIPKGTAYEYLKVFTFIHRYGGTPVYVHTSVEKFNRKYELNISLKAHKLLLKNISAGSTIMMPSALGVYLSIRRFAVIHMIRMGSTSRTIAITCGASITSVYQLRCKINTARCVGYKKW